MVLSKIENSKISKLYSISTAINHDRKGYYSALDFTTGFKRREDSLLDITAWTDKGVENYEGGLNRRQYVAIAKTSKTTATKDIKELLKKGCIIQTEGTSGRGTSYTVII